MKDKKQRAKRALKRNFFLEAAKREAEDEMRNRSNFLTALEVATMLKVNIMTIYRYIKAKRLKAYKIGKEFRIDKAEFEAFLKRVSTK